MKCGRFFTSLALASAVIGGALAQQQTFEQFRDLQKHF